MQGERGAVAAQSSPVLGEGFTGMYVGLCFMTAGSMMGGVGGVGGGGGESQHNTPASSLNKCLQSYKPVRVCWRWDWGYAPSNPLPPPPTWKKRNPTPKEPMDAFPGWGGRRCVCLCVCVCVGRGMGVRGVERSGHVAGEAAPRHSACAH